MAIDFDDPTTWDQPLTAYDAISLGIFAMNTLQYPDASTAAQVAALDFFTDGAIEALVKLREGRSDYFREVFVHAKDGEECWDPEIVGPVGGPWSCYAHEEECITLREHRERGESHGG